MVSYPHLKMRGLNGAPMKGTTMQRKYNSSLLLHCIVVAALSLSAHAADGTWKSASAGGNWASADNWVDGAIPGNGGVARFNFSGQTGSLQVQGSGSDTATLSVIDIYCALPSSSNTDSYFDQLLFNMVAPANIDLKNGIFAFRKNTLSSTSGLLVSGGGRLVLHAPQDISAILSSSFYKNGKKGLADRKFGDDLKFIIDTDVTR